MLSANSYIESAGALPLATELDVVIAGAADAFGQIDPSSLEEIEFSTAELVDRYPLGGEESVDIAQGRGSLSPQPKVDVVTIHDLAQRLSDPDVLGRLKLDRDPTAALETQSSHGRTEGFHPKFCPRLVTLLLSSYRRAKLLFKGKAIIPKSLKHVVADAVGVVAGGFTGWKAGALAGSIAGPVGIAIGGVLGGTGGAIAGRMAAKKFRYLNLNQAPAGCRKAEMAQEALQERLEQLRWQILDLKVSCEAAFTKRKGEISRAVTYSLQALRRDFSAQTETLTGKFSARLDDINVQLRTEEREILAKLPVSIWSLLFPSERDLLRSAVKRWFRRARRLVAKEKYEFLSVVDRSPESSLVFVRKFLADYDCELQELRQDILSLSEKFVTAHQRAGQIRAKAARQMESVRSELIRNFAGQVVTLHAELVNLITIWKAQIARSRDLLEREAKPAGVKL